MPRVSTNLASFSGGEVSPQVYGRVDIAKYATGCRTLENFVVRVHGGVQRRPGTYFCVAAKNAGKKARLIPFEYSITQAYVIEAGDLYFRFFKEYGQITSGSPATAVEIVTPYTELDLPYIMFGQSEDTLYLACNGYAPRVLTRASHTSWTLALHTLNEPPYLDENIDDSWAMCPSAITGSGITLVSEKDIFAAGHVGAWFRLKQGTTTFVWGCCEITAVTNAKQATATVKSDFGNNYVDIGSMSKANPCAVGVVGHGLFTGDRVMFEGITQAEWSTMNRIIYTITKTGADTFTLDGIDTTTYPAAAYVPGTDPGKVTGATKVWREGAFSAYRGYPDCVAFHEQRLYYFKDAYVFASKTGDFNDFGSAKTTAPLATDGFAYQLAAEKVNVIRWACSKNNLMLGATDGVWRLGAQTSTDPITPTNAKITQQSRQGAALLRAHSLGQSVMFVERLGLPTNKGEKVVEISYKWETDAYVGKDLSLLAEHITTGGILDWEFQRSPYPIIWCVRADGVLLGLTYEKDQDVIGWHRHPIDGEVEAVAVIPGDVQDDLWLVTKRTIDGSTVRYIEYMKPMRYGTDVTDAFFIDCGLTYDGAPVSSLGGLSHLKGKTVAILADGAVHPQVVVSAGGTITLEYEASKIQVGLPYDSTLETLDLEGGGAEGPAQGKKRGVSKVLVRFFDTGSGVRIGRGEDRVADELLDMLDFRDGTTLMGSPEPLVNGIIPVTFPRAWQREARIKVQTDNPLPCSVLSMVATMKTEDA